MTTLLKSIMGKAGLNFAHLAGSAAGKGRSAAADKDDSTDDDGKDKDAKADDADPEKKDDDKGDGGKDAKAGKDDSGKGGDEDDESDKDKDAKASDAKADDDDDEEMRGKSAVASARRRERARCAAIFGSRAAGRNPVLAANLAFNTSMPRKEALAVLEGTPAPQAAAAGSGARAAGNPRVDANGGAEPNAQSNRVANLSAWDAVRARNKALGG